MSGCGEVGIDCVSQAALGHTLFIDESLTPKRQCTGTPTPARVSSTECARTHTHTTVARNATMTQPA